MNNEPENLNEQLDSSDITEETETGADNVNLQIQESDLPEEVTMPETIDTSDIFEAEVAKTDVEHPASETILSKKTNRRILTGKVKSNKPDKSIIVSIERQVKHPLYKKYYKRTKRIMAHDELNQCGNGDMVKVKECRPMSARKRWELVEIIEKAK